VGAELLEYLLTGQLPQFDQARLQKSTTWLCNDLQRQGEAEMTYQEAIEVAAGKSARVTAPILATRKNGKQFVIALSGPLSTGHPADASLLALSKAPGTPELIIVNELLVRGNLPAATREAQQRMQI
jgi:hypothetical protein